MVLRYSSLRQYPVRVLNRTVVPRGGRVPPVEIGAIRERRPANHRQNSCCHRCCIAVRSPVAPLLLLFPVPLPIVLSRAIVLPLPLVLPHELTT